MMIAGNDAENLRRQKKVYILNSRWLSASLTICVGSKRCESRKVKMLDLDPSFYFPPKHVRPLENLGLLQTGGVRSKSRNVYNMATSR
jgi:hypothetical protein